MVIVHVVKNHQSFASWPRQVIELLLASWLAHVVKNHQSFASWPKQVIGL